MGKPDESRDQFNLGSLLLLALAGVVGTTLTVWAVHFLHLVPEVPKAVPHVAVLPFHSLSSSREDIRADQIFTNEMMSQLAHSARVTAVPTDTDADPVAVGRQFGVETLIMGKIERMGTKMKTTVQIVSAKDGKQIWTGSFDGNSGDLGTLNGQIEKALAPHLTALLD